MSLPTICCSPLGEASFWTMRLAPRAADVSSVSRRYAEKDFKNSLSVNLVSADCADSKLFDSRMTFESFSISD
jgi:hypothetical protein